MRESVLVRFHSSAVKRGNLYIGLRVLMLNKMMLMLVGM